MLPVVAIVGRPNVGKSTLFNALTRTRDALVADMPGVTRDRQYGISDVGDRPCVLIDTGGLVGQAEGIEYLTAQQVHQAIDESQLVLFVVSAREGLTIEDEEISQLKSPQKYYSEEDLKKATESTKELLDTGEARFSMNLITKSGKSIPFEYNSVTIKNQNNEFNKKIKMI